MTDDKSEPEVGDKVTLKLKGEIIRVYGDGHYAVNSDGAKFDVYDDEIRSVETDTDHEGKDD
jgi:hypothetical protein